MTTEIEKMAISQLVLALQKIIKDNRVIVTCPITNCSKRAFCHIFAHKLPGTSDCHISDHKLLGTGNLELTSSPKSPLREHCASDSVKQKENNSLLSLTLGKERESVLKRKQT